MSILIIEGDYKPMTKTTADFLIRFIQDIPEYTLRDIASTHGHDEDTAFLIADELKRRFCAKVD